MWCRLRWPLASARGSVKADLASVAEDGGEPKQAAHSPGGGPNQERRNSVLPSLGRPPAEPDQESGDDSDVSLGEPIRERELSLRERYARQTRAGSAERAAPADTHSGFPVPKHRSPF